MEKLISDLLLQNNSLIIPGFGSLIKSLSTGNITFNEFLKFNDGVLSAAIEKSKSVSKEEATKQIVGFATEVKSAIEKDGNYKLGSLGTFSKNEKGAIIFSGKVSTTASKPIPVAIIALPITLKASFPAFIIALNEPWPAILFFI